MATFKRDSRDYNYYELYERTKHNDIINEKPSEFDDYCAESVNLTLQHYRYKVCEDIPVTSMMILAFQHEFAQRTGNQLQMRDVKISAIGCDGDSYYFDFKTLRLLGEVICSGAFMFPFNMSSMEDPLRQTVWRMYARIFNNEGKVPMSVCNLFKVSEDENLNLTLKKIYMKSSEKFNDF